MNARDIGGALGIVAGAGLIAYGVHVTQSASPLWALILIIWFAHDFPWSSKKQ